MRVRHRLCLYADFLLFLIICEPDPELLIDLGAVSGVGLTQNGDDVTQLIDEVGNLFRAHPRGRLGPRRVQHLERLPALQPWTSLIQPVTTTGSAPASSAARYLVSLASQSASRARA